jgi:hypothetical protein
VVLLFCFPAARGDTVVAGEAGGAVAAVSEVDPSSLAGLLPQLALEVSAVLAVEGPLEITLELTLTGFVNVPVRQTPLRAEWVTASAGNSSPLFASWNDASR